MVHSAIADLFGAGLRIQNVASQVPEDVQQALEEVADQIDNVVRELRAFAFGQPR